MMRVALLVCMAVLCAGTGGQALAQAQPKPLEKAQPPRSVGDLISGEVSSIGDGRSFRLGYERIRLWGIDTPRSPRVQCISNGTNWRPFWGSVDALKACVQGSTVTCRVQRIQRRLLGSRLIAECWRDSDKEDLAACMVRSGWATDRPGFSGGHYASLEAEPKAVRRGLWQCDGEPPIRRWCYRGTGVPCERPTYRPRGPA